MIKEHRLKNIYRWFMCWNMEIIDSDKTSITVKFLYNDAWETARLGNSINNHEVQFIQRHLA